MTMAGNPTPNPTPATLVRDHVNIRSCKDVAWVTFDQHGVDTGEARFDMPGVSHETRTLEVTAENGNPKSRRCTSVILSRAFFFEISTFRPPMVEGRGRLGSAKHRQTCDDRHGDCDETGREA